MRRKINQHFIKIILSLFLVLISLFLKTDIEWYHNILYVISYIIVGYPIVLKAVKNIVRGKLFDENFLMTVATIGAFCIGEYKEAVAVMLFYQIGELFEHYAVGQSRKSIASLMDIRPDYANVYREGKVKRIDPDEVAIGEIILVKPGEKIPLDGIVASGEAMIDTKALTGEAIPRKVMVNDEVLSGCINNDGILKIQVNKQFKESTVSKILELVENASSRKSKSENFISKFARIYTPIVVIIALLLATIPPFMIDGALFKDWLYRALSFLVVSCPCALVISIPLSFFGGIGAASKMGILIKGSNYLEALSNVSIVVCDKTGTLTEGVFKVQKIQAIGYSKSDVLKYASHAEIFSNHPIALSLKEAYYKEINEKLVTATKEISGKGIEALVEGKNVFIGNEKWMDENHITFEKSKELGTILYVAIDGELVGTIVIADKIKEDSYKAIEALRKNNVKKLVMLTGDSENISKDIAQILKIDEYHSELLPQDKVIFVQKLIDEKPTNEKLLFVGDGINDAPVLALSDIGVAMGGLGSDAAIEAADVVIMTDEVSKIASSIQIAKKTMRIVRENIAFAITIKIGVLVLSACGLATMWAAVFADVGVSILSILNALRILKVKNK